MARSRFKIKEEHLPYFITLSVVDGISLFDDSILSDIMLDFIRFMQNKGIRVIAYVVMHNHVHLIIEGEGLSDHVRKLKSYTARRIIDSLKERGRSLLLKRLHYLTHDHHKDSHYQVWQEGFHPKKISTEEMMIQKIEYIHYNPVMVGFVDLPEYWRRSSARNYLGLAGELEIDLFYG